MISFEQISGLPNEFVNFIFEVSLCLILIMLVRRYFGGFLGARTCRLLWVVLIVRCLIPWSVPVAYHPTAVFHEIASTVESYSPAVESHTPVTGVVESFEPMKKQVVSPGISFESEMSLEGVVSESVFSSGALQFALVVIWGVGVFLLLGLAFYRNRRIVRFAEESPMSVPSWVQKIFLECRGSLDIKAWPVLIISRNTVSPCLVGAVRPRILLPHKFVENTTEERMRHVILHELMHLKQKDIWFSWLWTVALSLHWFNPLLWWAGRYMYFDCEAACDERVMGMLEAERRIEYGFSLVALLKSISNSMARRPGLSCIVEYKTNFERRLAMIKSYRKKTGRHIFAGMITVMILLVISLTSFAASSKATAIARDKAEIMGRVENFFLYNFQDITARKSLEWGKVEADKNGKCSIRYKCETLLWNKKWMIMNAIFTFDAEGVYVGYKNVSGYPRDKVVEKADTTTKEGMMALVEDFFSKNYRDITSRKTIDWGDVVTEDNGNRSIRYKCEATIWEKEKIIINRIFTFEPNGEFVSTAETRDVRRDDDDDVRRDDDDDDDVRRDDDDDARRDDDDDVRRDDDDDARRDDDDDVRRDDDDVRRDDDDDVRRDDDDERREGDY